MTKQAFCFVFDRVTGDPVWPIVELPVPASKVEKAAPTQPFPTWPLPFDRQGLQLDDLIDFTPELRQQALHIIKDYEYGPLYTPPSEKGTIVLPGFLGEADWAGAAFHPGKKMLYVASRSMPSVIRLSGQRSLARRCQRGAHLV